MQTTNEQLLDLLGQPHTQFVIPAYQRAYSWGERECRELWLDLHRAARASANHFMGTFLYAEDKPMGNAGEEAAGSLEELLFGLKGFCETFVTRSQSSGARMADAHNSYGVARVEGIISEKKLFGD